MDGKYKNNITQGDKTMKRIVWISKLTRYASQGMPLTSHIADDGAHIGNNMYPFLYHRSVYTTYNETIVQYWNSIRVNEVM